MNRKELRKMFYKEKDEEECVECPPAQDDDPLREGISNTGRRWKFVGAFLLLLFVVGVVLGITLRPSTDTETFIPPELIDLLPNASSCSGEALSNSWTPQCKAFEWLANDSNLESYSDQEKIQRYALATLYFSTNGNSWTRHDYWLSNADVCGKWYQDGGTINCNSDGEVSDLILRVNNLVGTIPPEIGLLSDSLGEFNIQGRMMLFNVSCSPIKNCQLGEHVTHVPITFATIGSHVCMHILLITARIYLSGNDLTGTIPTELGLLSNLEALGLYLNQLTGTISTELGLLSNLEVLSLHSNQLIGSVPTSLARLPLLRKYQSVLFQYKIQFLHYVFSCVYAHYRGALSQWQ